MMLIPAWVSAAAPNDISNNQRAWFDAVDLNGNGIYSDNPANNTAVGQWNDKSGNANHVSATGTNRPQYQHNSLTSWRHGIRFDGVNHYLQDTSDIWASSVSLSEIFIVATTDRVKSSALFSSTTASHNRLSSHMPWSNSLIYFDHGACCGAPARLTGSFPISLSTGYFWHFIGNSTQQAVVQDGKIRLSDTGVGTYVLTANSKFTIAAWANFGIKHQGRVFEAVFYQSVLNNAQRRLLSSYLSAKWSKPFDSSPDFVDVYAGDTAANNHYDFFVGGIGRDNGTQATGTSQGLTISDNNFLSADNKFVVAGVNYLLSSPTTGTSTADLPASYSSRANRDWFIDSTGSGGTVNLSFNAADIGYPVANGETFGLIYRAGSTGAFSEVATATMTAGTVTFTHLPVDGIYTLGKKSGSVNLALVKSVDDDTPNIGDTITFTLTVSNAGPDSATNASLVDTVPAGFGSVTALSFPAGTTFSVSGNTVNWSGIDVPTGSSVTATFTAIVLAP